MKTRKRSQVRRIHPAPASENVPSKSASGKKDYVGKSGVYPMSGPHPSGSAPLMGQMEWGQGDRGAAGYEDHGGSELTYQSGSLLGDLEKSWSGSVNLKSYVSATGGREVPVSEWPAFCGWFTRNFAGMETSIERREMREEHAEISSECLRRPLKSLAAKVNGNGVGIIRATVLMDHTMERIFDFDGPNRLALALNPAGWPTEIHIDMEDSVVVLHFTGEIKPGTAFSRNSWGE